MASKKKDSVGNEEKPKRKYTKKTKEIKEENLDLTMTDVVDVVTKVPSVDTSIISAIDDFRRNAVTLSWKRNDLITEAKKLFGSNISVFEFNNKQIGFIINGIRVPEEGYFSVK